MLEPSAGDGAFLRGLARSPLREAIACVTAIEPLALAAAQARRALRTGGLAGEVLARSAIPWAAGTEERFEAAVGNPPFVRYQFVSAADRAAAAALAARLGLRIHGVANLWIPVLLGALSRLRAGGAFAFVVPAEVLSGVAAGLVRSWLADSCRAVRLDSFPPGSFPGVLQEVMVLSGRRAPRAPGGLRLELVERRPGGGLVERAHRVAGGGAWTRYLLMREQVEALEAAAGGRHVEPLGAVATFEVSIVTGANPFFTLPDTGVARHNLSPWARPLLPRIRHAPGLRYTAADHARTRAAGARAWLLDLAAAPDPLAEPGPAAYLRAGEASGLPGRYKCRIREPWFRVPGIRAGELLLSKRSHRHPRVVLNAAGVLTTDTIYRGRACSPALPAAAVAAGFQNSLTLLAAKLEGRSFGGGVLELVPSEIARLPLPADPAAAAALGRLDAVARLGDPEALVAAVDAGLAARGLIEPDALRALEEARLALVARRLERNRRARAARVPLAA